MKAHATVSNLSPAVNSSAHRSLRYNKVKDGRKQPIRGLWRRGGKFIARLTALDQNSGAKQIHWVPLVAETVAAAQEELSKLKVKRGDNQLPILKQAPKLRDFIAVYLTHYDKVKDAKAPATIAKETGSLKLWAKFMGDTRINRINKAQIRRFMEDRQQAGMSPRTVNLDLIALRNVLKLGIDDGWLMSLPTIGMRPLKVTPKNRPLFTAAQLDALCAAAFEPAYTVSRLAKPGEQGKPLANAQQFVDYVRLMAYCGSRRNETLRLRWVDVDFERDQIAIGSDGLSKNGQMRHVNFNPKLDQHLREMSARRAPDSQWLFPSPQRGERDIPAKTFMESLRLARTKAGLLHIGFHDCRHFFISFCVMSGIDFMTVASWVGHQDGGILVGKTYGHLAAEHKKAAGLKVCFGPTVLEAAANN